MRNRKNWETGRKAGSCGTTRRVGRAESNEKMKRRILGGGVRTKAGKGVRAFRRRGRGKAPQKKGGKTPPPKKKKKTTKTGGGNTHTGGA